MNAQEAKELVNRANHNKIHNTLSEIYEEIKIAAKKGNTTLMYDTCYSRFTTEIIDILSNNGYHITSSPDTILISWQF